MEVRDIHVLSSSGGDDNYTDVAVLLGLRIDAAVVTRLDDRDWAEECERLLGVMPPVDAPRGGALNLAWLR